MGQVSTSEDNQDRRDDAEFSERKSPADLKPLMIAAAERGFRARRSKPSPKLKKSKKQLAAEAKYREREHARKLQHSAEAELRAEIQRLRAENDELRTLLKMRIQALRALPKEKVKHR